MKLHLGCGGKYIDGYLNIDYPDNKHSVMKGLKADRHADITKLKFFEESMDEIRLHHVFEHFPRAQAIALLVIWHRWLKTGGILRIEVPDFEKSAKVTVSSFKVEKSKYIALRHIFGSNEADWAVHFEGWIYRNIKKVLQNLGFFVKEKRENEWKGTYNFEIIALKKINKNLKEQEKTASDYLHNFLIDNSESEKKLYDKWILDYKKQIKNGLK